MKKALVQEKKKATKVKLQTSLKVVHCPFLYFPGEIFILYQSNPPPFFPLVLFLSYYQSFLLCPPAGNWYTFRREKSDLQELFSNYLQRGNKAFSNGVWFLPSFFFFHSFIILFVRAVLIVLLKGLLLSLSTCTPPAIVLIVGGGKFH